MEQSKIIDTLEMYQVPGYGGWSGAERCTFLPYTYARVCEALALTEPERGVGL